MSMNIKEIFEREFGLVLEKNEVNSRKKAQFVDLQAISNDGKMVFVEVKLLSNNEILPLNMRSVENKQKKYVVKQLIKYEDIIKSHKQKYPNPSTIRILPKVRLIVTKFDEAPERKSLLPRIREDIEKGMGWEENTDNLIMIDNPNEINVGDIFNGIQECELI